MKDNLRILSEDLISPTNFSITTHNIYYEVIGNIVRTTNSIDFPQIFLIKG